MASLEQLLAIRTTAVDTKEIQIYDVLVPAALEAKLSALVKRPIWQYGWRSNSKLDRFCFWHAHFAGGDENSRTSCEASLDINPELAPIREYWQLLKRTHLAGHEPLRVYANSHTYGVEGYVHVDNNDPDNYFTTVYYAHPTWDRNWAGETVFYRRDRDEIIAAVYPKPGRVITFRGDIPHAARGVSRECAELRVSIVIKSHRKDLDDSVKSPKAPPRVRSR